MGRSPGVRYAAKAESSSGAIGRAADWLANAGYDVVDAEPPQISKVAATWFDAMWADVGLMLPGLKPIAGAEELTFIQACLAQEMFKPVDQAAQQATWVAIHQHAADSHSHLWLG